LTVNCYIVTSGRHFSFAASFLKPRIDFALGEYAALRNLVEVARGEARGCLVGSAKLARYVRGFARHRHALIFLRVLRRQRANRLERDVSGAQFFDKISGLLERQVANRELSWPTNGASS